METKLGRKLLIKVQFDYKSNLQGLYPTTSPISNHRVQIELAYQSNQMTNLTRFDPIVKLFDTKNQ